ncbi:aspartate/glutamate racemase family protein [Streptococcus sobrinus]|nr:amino acid recemase [Streptococcus sobrinus]
MDNMKTIGLIGGMSWESTTSYYQIINETVKQELGGLHSAKILLYSVDFAEIEHYQATGDWEKSAQVLSDVALKLEKAGADFIIICTNTMHKVAPQIQQRISIPILHIAQATADTLLEQGIQKVGLLGTKYTMTQDFYKEKHLESGLEVLIPDDSGVEMVNRIIYDELCLGNIQEESKQAYLNIIEQFKNSGAEAVILGCTEIGLLVKQSDTDMSLFDTTLIHNSRPKSSDAGGGIEW